MELTKHHDDLYVPTDFEKHHHYYADAQGTKEYTGITTILGVIAKPALIQWAANQAIEHIKKHVAELPQTNDTGIYGLTLNLLDEARTAHAKKRDTAADSGTEIHATAEEWVKWSIELNEGVPIAPDMSRGSDWRAIKPLVEWAIKEKVRFIAAEQRLYSKTHWIAGTCDLVFEKDGKRYIGDIKTYKKIWDRVPLIQCAGYALMWEEMTEKACHSCAKEWPWHVPGCAGLQGVNRIDGYCVICLPKERAFNEAEDVLWSWDTEGDREAFLSAVRLYRYLKQK